MKAPKYQVVALKWGNTNKFFIFNSELNKYLKGEYLHPFFWVDEIGNATDFPNLAIATDYLSRYIVPINQATTPILGINDEGIYFIFNNGWKESHTHDQGWIIQSINNRLNKGVKHDSK